MKKQKQKKRSIAVLRCPRCNGFLFDAKHWYRFTTIYNNKKHCFNCGRDWELANGKMQQFPLREKEER